MPIFPREFFMAFALNFTYVQDSTTPAGFQCLAEQVGK